MAKDSPRQWDTTPASNTDIGGITLAENVMRPPAVNNAMREHMGQIAEYIDEMSYPTAGGSADALTLTPATASAAYASNDVWTFKAASSNTGAATLNISGLGAKAIRKISGGTDVALSAGDIAEDARYTVVYDSAANAAAGAWILVGGNTALASTTEALTGADAIKSVTPDALYALWGKGIDVTAAATLTLGEGGLFNVVGNTGITDIDFAVPADGRRATLIFEGAPLLTHNATTLNLPGAANIQVVAGDRCDIVQDDADNIYVTNYTRAAAAPYQAGSWTPTILVNGSSTGVTYSAQVGSYIKFGALVWVQLRIILTNNGSSTGAVTIGGLPFTAKTVSGSAGVLPITYYAGLSGIPNTVFGEVTAAGTTLSLRTSAATTITLLTDTNVTNTADIVMVGWYEAAA